MQNRQLRILAAALALTGLGVFYYKAAVLGLPLWPRQQTEVWSVEARVRFEARNRPVRVTLRIPESPPGYEIIDESFVSSGYGLTSEGMSGKRSAIWAKRRASGQQTLYYRAVIHTGGSQGLPKKPSFPTPPENEEPFRSAAESLLDDVRRQSADISTFASLLVARLADPSPSQNVRHVLESEMPRAQLAIHLLAGARIPAREIRGIRLKDRLREAPLDSWLAVHNDAEWIFIDPGSGTIGLPQSFFVWSWGDGELIDIDGGRRSRVDFSVLRNTHGSMEVAQARATALGSPLRWVSFLDLPISSQAVYQVLVLIPLGALMVVVLRNVVGIPTFGTFMPVLIALAFRETRLLWGLVLFSSTVAVGLLARRYLERMKLLLVPRMSAVLTIVVLTLAFTSLVSHGMGIERALSVALFPIVILTMVIERMSVVWEESGARSALQQALGTVVVAILSYMIFSNDWVQHLTFVFPELLFLVLAAMLLLGRYTGYRLSELYRFSGLTRETPS